jgi:hypothetical protein
MSPQRDHRLGSHIYAVHLDCPCIRIDHAVEASEKSSLARAALADEREGTGRGDSNARTVQGEHSAVPVYDIMRLECAR